MEKNFKNQSLNDIAYGYLLERDIKENEFEDMGKEDEAYEFISFDELFDTVANRAGIPAKGLDDAKAELLSLLNEDKRFVKNDTNGWDLNRQGESMVDAAFDYLTELYNNREAGEDISLDFQTLFDEVSRRLHLSATEALKKKGQFYTNLTLDGRFIILNNYRWDLSANHQFVETPGINDFYLEAETEAKEAKDKEETEEDEAKVLGEEDTTASDEDSQNEESENE